MSSILYYSNFCDHSKRILQTLSKSNVNNVHFICIDRREKNDKGKIFIVLDNGQKIVMPENVTRVPALLLLNEGYHVIYGEAILQHLKPRHEVAVKQATRNNMEPMAFAFEGGGSFGSSVVSDQYSFLDQDPEQLSASGNGGIRQMHNYVDLNYVDNISPVPQDDSEIKNSGRIGNVSLEQLQSQREQDFQSIVSSHGSGPYAPKGGPPQPMQQQKQQQQNQTQYNPNQFAPSGGRR